MPKGQIKSGSVLMIKRPPAAPAASPQARCGPCRRKYKPFLSDRIFPTPLRHSHTVQSPCYEAAGVKVPSCREEFSPVPRDLQTQTHTTRPLRYPHQPPAPDPPSPD